MKIWNTIKNLVVDDEGMEMVEWAIVGVVFAVAAAAFWGQLASSIDVALTNIADKVDPASGGTP